MEFLNWYQGVKESATAYDRHYREIAAYLFFDEYNGDVSRITAMKDTDVPIHVERAHRSIRYNSELSTNVYRLMEMAQEFYELKKTKKYETTLNPESLITKVANEQKGTTGIPNPAEDTGGDGWLFRDEVGSKTFEQEFSTSETSAKPSLSALYANTVGVSGENQEAFVDTAKSVGFTDAEIQTFLKSKEGATKEMSVTFRAGEDVITPDGFGEFEEDYGNGMVSVLIGKTRKQFPKKEVKLPTGYPGYKREDSTKETSSFRVVWKMKDGRKVKDENVFDSRSEAETYAGTEGTQMESEGVESYTVEQASKEASKESSAGNWVIRSKKYKNKRTGEIVTQIPIMEMDDYEEVAETSGIKEDEQEIIQKGTPATEIIAELKKRGYSNTEIRKLLESAMTKEDDMTNGTKKASRGVGRWM